MSECRDGRSGCERGGSSSSYEIYDFSFDAPAAETVLVSVVVPVYNTPASVLRRCVSALVTQTHCNIEVILVDDGSDHACAKHMDALAKSDGRIAVLRSAHRGASVARNLGLGAARGAWIAFSDSDDVYLPQFVEQALNIALKCECDMVCGSVVPLFAKDVASDYASARDFPIACVGKRDGEALRFVSMQVLGPARCKGFSGPQIQGRGPYGKLYRAELLRGLQFEPDIMLGEDALFNYRAIERANSLAVADAVWYLYYQNAASTVHGLSVGEVKRSIEGILAACREDDDLTPFRARASSMVAAGFAAIARNDGLLRGCSAAVSLAAFAAERGCFEADVLRVYELPWHRKVLFWLCRNRMCRLGYLYWGAKTALGERLGHSLWNDDYLNGAVSSGAVRA